MNLATERGLLYRDWVESRRAYVAKVSNGRLGYVHMADMGQGSLQQLFVDLDVENRGREGVVVDVRNNNGGFVNPYAIDVLARRGYLQFTPRDFGTGGGRSVVGQRSLERPTVLVTNMHSLSDAEDFTEGYRSLKLGPVVGEPTAGWIIFTSDAPLLDGATAVRMPFERITDAAGKDMEMHPRAGGCDREASGGRELHRPRLAARRRGRGTAQARWREAVIRRAIVPVALGVLLVGGRQAAGQRPESPAAVKRYFEMVRREFSAKNAYDQVAFMDRYFRWPGNTGFDASIDRVEGDPQGSRLRERVGRARD